MFVKSIMIPTHLTIAVQETDTLKIALEKLESHGIDGLPILNGDLYVGVLTRFNIYENYFKSNLAKEDYLTQTLAKDIASHQNQYLLGKELFEKTLLELKDFPLLAVVDENRKFLGVVTRADVLEQFESVFGTNRPGIRITFTSVETEGRLARLSEIAHNFRIHVISLVTFDETDKLVRRIVMKIEPSPHKDKFIQKLEQSGFRVLDIHELG
ncbi:CBS domain-containing protein [Cytobacillus sp. Hz8]|uniref:CBS domain-containing protein n=1 Tax=Cytobacillus sp. Hz8 TaxID=3347168 RepID=UPI0035E232B1